MGYFTKASLNCIAAQLNTTKIEGLADIFSSLDEDKDGRLSMAEFAVGLAELGVDPDDVFQLMDSVDVNHDGYIEYSEFVASLLVTQGKLVEDVIGHAFRLFDTNGDEYISLEELRTMLSGDGPLVAVLPDGKTVEQVLADVDASKDGKISCHEFQVYLQRQSQLRRVGVPQDGLSSPCVNDLTRTAHDDAMGADESIDSAMRRLATRLGRPESDLSAQALRLMEEHWMSTVGDLRGLDETEWPRLGLPLKLECLLRDYVAHPSAQGTRGISFGMGPTPAATPLASPGRSVSLAWTTRSCHASGFH